MSVWHKVEFWSKDEAPIILQQLHRLTSLAHVAIHKPNTLDPKPTYTKEEVLDIIGPNIDKDALVRKGDRQGAKEAMAINRHLEGIREKITGKPEKVENRWWL